MVTAEGLGVAIELFKTMIVGTSVLGTTLIFQAMIVLASLLLITRKTSDWGTLLFPVLMGWQIVGANMSNIYLTLAGVLFVISTLSSNGMMGVIGAVKGSIQSTSDTAKSGIKALGRPARVAKGKKRLDIKESMTKLKIRKTESPMEMIKLKQDSKAKRDRFDVTSQLRQQQQQENLIKREAMLIDMQNNPLIKQYGTADQKVVNQLKRQQNERDAILRKRLSQEQIAKSEANTYFGEIDYLQNLERERKKRAKKSKKDSKQTDKIIEKIMTKSNVRRRQE